MWQHHLGQCSHNVNKAGTAPLKQRGLGQGGWGGRAETGKSRELLTFRRSPALPGLRGPDWHMDSIQWMSLGQLLYTQHCVRLRGYVVSQLVCGWGTQTHTADSLPGWYRGWRRVRKEEPRHPCLRGCPAKGEECPQEHTSHQRPRGALPRFLPHLHIDMGPGVDGAGGWPLLLHY